MGFFRQFSLSKIWKSWNKHFSHNKHTFLAPRNCAYYEWAQYLHMELLKHGIFIWQFLSKNFWNGHISYCGNFFMLNIKFLVFVKFNNSVLTFLGFIFKNEYFRTVETTTRDGNFGGLPIHQFCSVITFAVATLCFCLFLITSFTAISIVKRFDSVFRVWKWNLKI